jgi:adenylate kinase family enzyme
MRVYEEANRPLVEWYGAKGLLVNIPAYGTPEEIFQRTWTCAKG